MSFFKMCSHGNVKYFIFNMFIAGPTNRGKLTGCLRLSDVYTDSITQGLQKTSPWICETNMPIMTTCVKPSKRALIARYIWTSLF